MTTRQREQRPPHGLPKGIVLLATPEGWRHTVLTAEGGMLCGRLAGVPVGADPEEAQLAAAAMLVDLAREFHRTSIKVTWDPPRGPTSRTGHITAVGGDEIARTDGGA